MQTPAGNELQYTFVQDFMIADCFGVAAVKDTFKRAFEEWKSDYKALTEIVIATNWGLWRWYDHMDKHPNDKQAVKMYDEYTRCYNEASQYALDNLKGEEMSYYYMMTN